MHVRIPFEPLSKKNGMRIVRRGQDGWQAIKSSKIRQQQSQIAELAQLHAPPPMPVTPSDDVRVTIVHRFLLKAVDVYVEAMGPPAKVRGSTGRARDLQNLSDTILDALEGIAYANDRQVAELHMYRVPE